MGRECGAGAARVYQSISQRELGSRLVSPVHTELTSAITLTPFSPDVTVSNDPSNRFQFKNRKKALGVGL
ncbi:hypothetical protein chiPu_0018769 [Chiloscyllium punctatum]|uniref:Uncharacterized protein n=1 Tax=Chiloscyllium punctatum TaxID=137246 RepID=A0A401RPP2_CHIPU|nr:hypothetical protein [Chiloscyllium punctatum]